MASGTGAKKSQRTVRWLVRAEPVRSPLTLPPHALRRALHRERPRAFLTKSNFLDGDANAGRARWCSARHASARVCPPARWEGPGASASRRNFPPARRSAHLARVRSRSRDRGRDAEATRRSSSTAALASSDFAHELGGASGLANSAREAAAAADPAHLLSSASRRANPASDHAARRLHCGAKKQRAPSSARLNRALVPIPSFGPLSRRAEEGEWLGRAPWEGTGKRDPAVAWLRGD